jgi:hypothetical protein
MVGFSVLAVLNILVIFHTFSVVTDMLSFKMCVCVVFSAQTDEIVKSDIWYHYKEGFSNAVRRSVKIQDLLDTGRM